MDEVGLLITDIDSSGMLRFTNVGGFDDRAAGQGCRSVPTR